MKRYFIIALSFLIAVSASAQETAGYKFDFGGGATAPGYTRVGINCSYTDELGYGFEMVHCFQIPNRRPAAIA